MRRAATLQIGRAGPWWLPRTLELAGPGITSHKHVIGLTGQGKSKFLAHCFVALVSQGIACSLIDPHSDLADDVLGMLADRGLADDRLLFVDFGRRDRFVPFNVLRQPYPDDTVAAIMVEACKRVWPALADGAAPMFENVMLAGCRTLIQNRLPFSALALLITDERYRNQLLANVTDPLTVHYFRATFDPLSLKEKLDQAQSSLRRVFLLNFPDELRYALGQRENLLDVWSLMNEGRSAIYDLGGLGDESQRFLGSLITTGYEQATKARSDLPEPRRAPHHVFIDEFSRFSSSSVESLAILLSEARKYRVTLWLAHQTWGQLSETMANALQNATRIAFSLGPDDARIMARSFATYDPLAVKFAESEEAHGLKQFFGVQDTFEQMASELQALRPRQLMIRYPELARHFWFWRRPETQVKKVKTASVHRRTSPESILRLREEYAQRHLRPADTVKRDVDALLAKEEPLDANEPPDPWT